ncbi:hypothetical protein Cni_G03216 [Canna indica]|uniref:UBX domain-containing protein n=1 Tax=Canna indica TaxID=4628 RepID=A0AAQ3JR84_9LILI|nr:hypothetical protein Cni_G03216 [Canna indica]
MASNFKRRRISKSVETEIAQVHAKLDSVAAELGHEIRVFLANSQTIQAEPASSDEDEADDFYDLSAEDYYRLMSLKADSQILKTQKMREAEAAAHREKLIKAIIRVRFPDDYVLEAKFQSSETIQTLVDLLKKVIGQPNVPFYLYTVPPKTQIVDLSKDFYSAGFSPGANVYFSYDLPDFNGSPNNNGPFLRDDIRILGTLGLNLGHTDLKNSATKPAVVENTSVVINTKPTAKSAKPKWLKL